MGRNFPALRFWKQAQITIFFFFEIIFNQVSTSFHEDSFVYMECPEILHAGKEQQSQLIFDHFDSL